MDPTSRKKGSHTARRCVARESDRRGGINRGPGEETVPLSSTRVCPVCLLEEDGLPAEETVKNEAALGNGDR